MFDVPTSLSPSRVQSFTKCPLAFRFASIQNLPDPGSVSTLKGTIVHRVLELLYGLEPGSRTLDAALDLFPQAWAESIVTDDFLRLCLDAAQNETMQSECRTLIAQYFDIEDPTTIEPVGTELRIEARMGRLELRGIIDRLDRAADGTLVINDYKTGRAPLPSQQQERFAAMHFYAWLCAESLGERPSEMRLIYVPSKQVLSATPTEQSIRFLPKRTAAVFNAIEQACTTGVFRTQKGSLCSFCSFKRWCPEFGGDPDRAAEEAPVVYAVPGRTA